MPYYVTLACEWHLIFIDEINQEWLIRSTYATTDDWTLKSCDFMEMHTSQVHFHPIYSVFRANVCHEIRNNPIKIHLRNLCCSSKKITTFPPVPAHTKIGIYLVWYCISCWRDCLMGRNCCLFFVSSGANLLYDFTWRNRRNSKHRMNRVCVCAIVGVDKKVTQWNVQFRRSKKSHA